MHLSVFHVTFHNQKINYLLQIVRQFQPTDLVPCAFYWQHKYASQLITSMDEFLSFHKILMQLRVRNEQHVAGIHNQWLQYIKVPTSSRISKNCIHALVRDEKVYTVTEPRFFWWVDLTRHCYFLWVVLIVTIITSTINNKKIKRTKRMKFGCLKH